MLTVEKAIEEKLRTEGPCGFEEVVMALPKFSWPQIFVAVDCMSREGRLSLYQLGYSTYQISLGSLPSPASLRLTNSKDNLPQI